MEQTWAGLDIEDILSTTASTGTDSTEFSTGGETENSYYTCSEPSDDGASSVESADIGQLLVRGRWTWTDDRIDRYRRARLDGWQDWRFFTDSERLLRLTSQAFEDVLEEAIRKQNDEYLNLLERETDSS